MPQSPRKRCARPARMSCSARSSAEAVLLSVPASRCAKCCACRVRPHQAHIAFGGPQGSRGERLRRAPAPLQDRREGLGMESLRNPIQNVTIYCFYGARGGTRTRTTLRSRDFKSLASTGFATRAAGNRIVTEPLRGDCGRGSARCRSSRMEAGVGIEPA